MLEHDEAGSAVTLPPPPPAASVVPPLLPSSLPPQPAAATASAPTKPTSATALKPFFTLPPPSPSGSASNTTTEYPRWGGQTQARRSPTMGAAPKWRNWQTRRTQNPVPLGECGFDSHLRHRTVERNRS